MANDLADRIVTSHKEAAKRAADYLQQTRNLKLKPTEALELVARVLGAANWQTLHGLAKQGQVPRRGHFPKDSDTRQNPAPVPEYAADMTVSEDIPESDVQDIQRLALYYGLTGGHLGEHPELTRQAWKDADVDRPYWEWVFYEIIGDCRMLPWEADELESYQLARAVGITVTHTGNGRWLANSTKEVYVEVYYANSEDRAWAHAGEAADFEGIKLLGARWHKLPQAEKLQVLKERFSPE